MAKINGTLNNDRLVGTDLGDRIFGKSGQDTLFGNGGNDFLEGGTGDDTLNAASGDDTLKGQFNDDTLFFSFLDPAKKGDVAKGGTGDDTIINVTLNARIEGGFGYDRVYLALNGRAKGISFDIEKRYDGLSSIEAVGGSFTHFDDEVRLGLGGVDVWGGDGDDLIVLDYSGDTLANGKQIYRVVVDLEAITSVNISDQVPGAPAPPGSGLRFEIRQFERADITGSSQSDRLEGGGGADRLVGGSGADKLVGRAGADTLLGGRENDRIEGDAGRDQLEGGQGEDTISLGHWDAVRDVAKGDGGADLFRQVGPNDRVIGGSGFDRMEVDFQDAASGVTAMQKVSWVSGLPGKFTKVEILGGTFTDHSDRISARVALTDLDGGGGSDQLTLDYGKSVGLLGPRATEVNLQLSNAGRTSQVLLDDGFTYEFEVKDFERFIVTGTPGNDSFVFGDGDDFVVPGQGHDRITTGSGRDTVDLRLPFGAGTTDIHDFDMGVDTLLVSLRYLENFCVFDDGDDLRIDFTYAGKEAETVLLRGLAGEGYTAFDFFGLAAEGLDCTFGGTI